MAKKFWAEEKMTDLTVDELRQEHETLILKRMKRRGDSERAMYSLQEEFGLGYWSQMDFQYKKERKPSERFLTRLRKAILLVTSESIKKELAKLEIEAAKGNVAPDLGSLRVEAKALLAKIEAAKRAA